MQEPATQPSALDPVQAQYERWVYPPRAYDLTTLPLLNPFWHYQDLRAFYWSYWPSAPFRDDLDILVAGCGSLSAAAQAFVYPRSRVTGIDVSRASLEHTEYLKQKHNLTNVTLRQLPLEEVSALNAQYDFIICHGVLHHIKDPAVGLRALGQMLRPNGVIDIMVYGKYGRLGVTLLQELFRVMGLQQDEDGLRVVKDTLAALPPNHPVQTYRRLAAEDLASDEGLVDTFLHRRDQPFACDGCLDLVQEAGLVFQGWKENGLYHLDTRLAPNDPLWPHLQKLNQRQLWQAVEMLDATVAGHWFYACRPERDPATYVIQFKDEAFLDYIPVRHVTQMAPPDPAQRRPAMIARPPFPPMGLDENQALIFQNIDAIRSVRQCLTAAGIGAESPGIIDLARNFFSSLWRTGYALFRLPDRTSGEGRVASGE
jgi:SAM-dependent methyltransferase